MNYKVQAEELNNLILEGKILDAFEKFYADDVVMQENNNEPVAGKSINLEREKEFFGKISEVKNVELKSTAYGENTTMAEWAFHFIHKEFGELKMNQVTVQHWKDGKIINERFYYSNN